MRVPWSLRGDVSEEALDAIAAAVDDAETRTSGEVHVHIVHRLRLLEKPRERAVRTFRRLRMDQTRERNGVLLFVVMTKRCFEIVADEGIDEKIDPARWGEIATDIASRIEHDGFPMGIAAGVRQIGALLAEHFPRPDDDRDELPNRPTMS